MAAGGGGNEFNRHLLPVGIAQPLVRRDTENALWSKSIQCIRRKLRPDNRIGLGPAGFVVDLCVDVPTTHLRSNIIGGVNVGTAEFYRVLNRKLAIHRATKWVIEWERKSL